MTLDEVNSLNSTELIDLYKFVVELDHYDPYVTPVLYKQLRESGVSQDILKNIILSRIENKT